MLTVLLIYKLIFVASMVQNDTKMEDVGIDIHCGSDKRFFPFLILSQKHVHVTVNAET